jgi:hypothetical protein
MTATVINDPPIVAPECAPPAPAAAAATAAAPALRHIAWMSIALAAIVLIGMIFAGISYRRWAWDFTAPGRFRYDINRNFNFGLTGNRVGFLNIYEDQIRDNPPVDTKMDYPPLRLGTFQAWAAWTRWRHPEIQRWRPDYDFNAPLMRYYTTLEALACIAAFLIVRHWLRVCALEQSASLPPKSPLDAKPRLPLQTGLLRATLAFGVLWFDPGIAIIAHGWPSPNMWAIPIYLWAVLLCLWDFWFIAGVVMGAGAMMQGQQLLVAAAFVLWPLFAGRPTRAFRWASGSLFTFMLVASGWMLTGRPDIQLPARQMNWPAAVWVSLSLILLALVGLRTRLTRTATKPRPSSPTGLAASAASGVQDSGTTPATRGLGSRAPYAIAAAAAISLTWPALLARNPATIAATLIAAVLLVLVFWHANWTIKRYLLPLTAGACLLLCIPFFGATTAWWQIGFVYGTERFPDAAMPLANNLPSLLRVLLGWNDIHDIAVTIPASFVFHWPSQPLPITVREFLLAIYIALLIPACAAIARQWRRRDPNLLIALVLPWLLFYTVLPQMSPRYAVFVAGMGVLCIGASLGPWLLILFFSALTVAQSSLCMMDGNRIGGDASFNVLFNGQMRGLLDRLNPGVAWAEVLAAGVLFYVAFTRGRGRALFEDQEGLMSRNVP